MEVSHFDHYKCSLDQILTSSIKNMKFSRVNFFGLKWTLVFKMANRGGGPGWRIVIMFGLAIFFLIIYFNSGKVQVDSELFSVIND